MIRRQIERIVAFEEREFWPALVSAIYFFCLLFGYFMLRPLRDAMGLDGGVDSLRILFLVTLLVMIIANLAFGFVASRLPRRFFIPLVYWGAVACLAGFLALLVSSDGTPSPLVGKVFYVWLSVFNLFAVSVFWGFMADIFTLPQSKRLFGFIGVGGTAGAICGSAYTGALASLLGNVGLFASAMVLIAGVAVSVTILARLVEQRDTKPAFDAHLPPDTIESSARPLGGASWHGIRDVLRSPALTAIAVYVCLFTILSTFLYFEKARIVEAFTDDQAARASIFGWIEFAGQSATILIQLFITGRLMRSLGVGSLLAIVPLVTLIGFIALLAAPTLLLLAVFEASRRACNFALSKPARETLFTVLPREEKYKAKSFIDTFVYRSGDTIGTLADKAMAALGAGIGILAVSLAIASFTVAIWLGRMERRRARADAHSHQHHPNPSPSSAPIVGSGIA